MRPSFLLEENYSAPRVNKNHANHYTNGLASRSFRT